MKRNFIIAATVIYLLLSLLFVAMRKYAPEYQFAVLETGNTIMFVLSFVTYMMVAKTTVDRPQVFVRSVYASSFLKLMVCMMSLLVYVMLNRSNIHKPSVFALFGIYAVYTITETWILSRLVRDKK